jgi:acetyl-CoA carboxylase carboxyl transferase subunit alpha
LCCFWIIVTVLISLQLDVEIPTMRRYLNGVINVCKLHLSQVRRDLYLGLTAVQRLSVARHPHRPTFLDHVLNITDKWVELHGDRAGYDDPALVCGIGKMDDMSFMFIGHQKGRNTKENIYRNFAMPTPNGYALTVL